MIMKSKSRQLAYLLLSSLLFSGSASADRISAGSAHNLVVRGDSYSFTWGANENGQLGDGSTLDALNPLNVVNSRYQAINGGIAVTAYGNNNLVLMDDGTLLGWGDNTSGQLGSGVLYSSLYKPFGDKNEGPDPETDPDAVDDENDEDVTEPTNAAIEFPTEVVDPEGVPIANVVAMSTGASFTAAIRQDTTVIVWGDLSAFEDVEEERYGSEPYRDKYFDPEAEIIDSPYLNGDPAENTELVMRDAAGNPVTGIMDIAVGDDYLLALTDQGFVLAWGDNSTGQLADGTYTSRLYPVFVQNTQRQPISRITSVAANGSVSMAVRADGFVLGWGGGAVTAVPLNETGQQALPLADLVRDGLGNKISDVRRLALGSSHILAIKFNNTVIGWGNNSNGQLGDGTNADVEGTTTVIAGDGKPLGNIYEIAVGDTHSIAARADGQVFAWGLGENGRLGDGTNIDSYYAVKVRDRSNLPFSLY
jgi:alpha-tubulin suppressor-like RCC1 family protein